MLVGYTRRRRLTIQETHIDANLTDFPVLVKLTSANFNFANTTTTGFDIRFTDHTGTNLLSYERERHDKAGQQAEYWVRVPSVSGTVNTDIFVYFQDNPAIPDGANPTDVWDANTLASWRLREASGAQIFSSATGGLNSVTNSLVSVEGRIGLGMSSNGTQFAGFGNVLNFERNTPWTVGFLVRVNIDGTNMMLVAKQDSTNVFRGWGVWRRNNNRVRVDLINRSGTGPLLAEVESTNLLTVASGWTHIVATHNGSGLTSGIRIFFNGIEETLIPLLNTLGNNTIMTSIPFNIASRNNGNQSLNGQIDEVRISSIVRSPAWNRADFHSGADTLLIYGAEETMVHASITGLGTLLASGLTSVLGQASITGLGALLATGAIVISSSATIIGTGLISAIGTMVNTGHAVLSGIGNLTSSGISVLTTSAIIIGQGLLSATGIVINIGRAILSGIGMLRAIIDPWIKKIITGWDLTWEQAIMTWDEAIMNWDGQTLINRSVVDFTKKLRPDNNWIKR